jgi:predicted O-methyltransferase YrrM
MHLINDKAEAYSKKYSASPDALLAENEAYTLAHHPHAQMHSGQVQGKLLEMLSLMIKPRKILEIGTFTGFSALCLVKGLETGGILHTIEIREEDARLAADYFTRAAADDKIRLHTGNALDIIPQLRETWDLVFIDADKVSYIEYYELTLPTLRKGGWIIADNVLFHGQVLEEQVSGKNAKAIHAFNEHVAADSRVEQVMLTVRDGLLIIRKL